MTYLRRLMLSSVLDISKFPESRKIYYTAESKLIPVKDSLGSTIIIHTFDNNTGNGVIICAEDIVQIGDKAFERSEITSVILPDSLQELGFMAFSDCYNLTEVKLGNIQRYSDHCFNYTNIKKVYFTGNLSQWAVTNFRTNRILQGASLFIDDSEVTVIDSIPDVNQIMPNAFYGCLSIKDVTISSNIKSIGEYAFYNCTNLSNLTINDGVNNILTEAFYNCENLTGELIIPASVTNIWEYAFCNTKISSAKILGSIDNYPRNGIFYLCKDLVSIDSKYSSEDKRCVIVNGNLCDFAPAGLTTYTLPNTVTTIHNLRNSNLTGFILPDSVESITDYAFTELDGWIDCSNLTKIPRIIDTSIYSYWRSDVIVPDSLYDDWLADATWQKVDGISIIKKSDWDALQTN